MLIKVKGYFQGNLGDDLFLELLTKRYPSAQFVICSWKRYKRLYSDLKNVKYISLDSMLSRIEGFLYRKFLPLVCLFNKSGMHLEYLTEEYIEQKWEKRCDQNILITGSGFCNHKEEFDTLPLKFKKEERYYKRRPYVIGCNFGPFYHNEYYKMYKTLFKNTMDLCFRDEYSRNLFLELPQSRFESDIVFSYPVGMAKEEKQITLGNYMLISVANLKKDEDRTSSYIDKYISFIRRIIQWNSNQNKKSILVGFSEEQHDGDIIHTILSEIENCDNVDVYLYPKVSSNNILQLFKNASDVLATRYHAMILGLMFEKKVYAINYNEKVGHVLDGFGSNIPRINLSDMNNISGNTLSDYGFTISKKRLQELKRSAERQFLEIDRMMGYDFERP